MRGAFFVLGVALAIPFALGAGVSAEVPLPSTEAGGITGGPSGHCELHAWPANGLRSIYHGWFHGAINDGAVQGREGYERLPPDPLSTAEQAARLRSSSLTEMLDLPDYEVVVHDEALSSSTIRHTPGRIVADSPRCYAELMTDDVIFQQDVINGRFLKVLFRFRRFDGADAPTVTFGAYTQRRLELFPPAEEAQEADSFAELSDQYGQALAEFGAALNKPGKAKKSKGDGRGRK